MSKLVYLFTPYFSGVVLYFMVGKILPYRRSPWYLFLYSLFLPACFLVKLHFGSQSLLAQTVTLLATVLAYVVCPLLLFDGSRWKRIWVTAFFFAIQLCCDLICYFLFSPKYGPSGELYPAEAMLLYMLLFLGLFISICSLCILLFRTITIRKFQPFYLLFLIFPLSLTALASCYVFPNYTMLLWSIGVLLGLGAEVGLLEYTITQEKKTILEQELQATRHAMALEHQHYQEVESRREGLARIRHDFNNQLAAIQQMIGHGANDDAQRMIEHLAEDIRLTQENPYCTIPVVNAVLAEKETACANMGLKLEVDLLSLPAIQIEPLHLCSIFSNLLDNAIAGAQTSHDKNCPICLTSRMDGDYLFIKTVNASEAPRKSSTRHGLGQHILEDLSARYHGQYIGKYEDGIYTAVVTLQQS